MNIPSTFISHDLGHGSLLFQGVIPETDWVTASFFAALWDLKPAERPWIMIHGRPVQIPRWQQAYEQDYRFSGRVSTAVPVPQLLLPLWNWIQQAVDPRLNGMLLSWYDSATGDYIGAHHDKTKDIVPGSPIVTVSFGASRIFRLTHGKTPDRQVRNFEATAGAVFVMPWDTNKEWKHEVPHRKCDTGRRVSVTFRAFSPERKSKV